MTVADSAEARSVSICNAIDESELRILARATTTVEFAPGEIFRHEGAPPDYLFNVVSGDVKLFKLLADGRRQIVGFLTVGDFIGFGRPEAAACSAEAITPVRLCRFEKGRFRALLETYPGLERRLLAVASDEIAAGQEHMILLGQLTAHERVGRFLLARAETCRRRGASGNDITLSMGRADIADYLGLTTETVSRTFAQMRQSGYVDYRTSRQITLKNPAALSAAAKIG